MFTLLALTPDEQSALATFQGRLCLVAFRRPGQDFPGHFPASTAAQDMLWRELGRRGEAFSHLGAVLFSPDFEPARGIAVSQEVLRRVTCLAVMGDLPEGLPNELQDLPTEAALARMRNVRVYPQATRALGESLTASGAKVLPRVAGRIHHPVHGEPHGVWLRPGHPQPVEKPGPTVVDLVDRFHLDPASRDALGVYLCGLFHAVSLESPRPILLVDSWVRGLGKSCLCACVARLLDGRPSSVQLGDRNAEDRVTAHMATGARALVGGNLDGKTDFNPMQLTRMATDGGLAERVKYGRETTLFDGLAPMLNVVYGAASLSVDIIRRSLRVEFQGRGIVKGPGTTDLWCRDRRDAIIQSILALHAEADEKPSGSLVMPQGCRFEDFLYYGARAWAVVTGATPGEVIDRVEVSMLSSNAYFTDAVRSLHRHDAEAFDGCHGDLQGMAADSRAIVDFSGARALGYLYNGTNWRQLS
jgi:hypothetical protein